MNEDAVPLIARRAPTWRERIAARIVTRELSSLERTSIRLRYPDGSFADFGPRRPEPELRVHVHDWRFFWRALTAGDIGLGESYMAGEWTTNDLTGLCAAFLREGARSTPENGVWTLAERAANGLRAVLRANTRRGSRRNIHAHYDLGNEFFSLFLDHTMLYSCADYGTPNATLEEAQFEKIDSICRRLDLRPGRHVLEIGCGWGGFAIHAARRYGAAVTGITISEEQYALATERVREAGLEHLVEILFLDYREVEGTFDAIVSIEMLEAAGEENFATWFEICDAALRPGGKAVVQTITVPDERFDEYRKGFDWIRKYIFPGGLLPSVAVIRETVAQRTGLEIADVREIGPFYATTLREWRTRLFRHLADVRAFGVDDEFLRTWDFYLASCEAAFAVRHVGNAQVLLEKPR